MARSQNRLQVPLFGWQKSHINIKGLGVHLVPAGVLTHTKRKKKTPPNVTCSWNSVLQRCLVNKNIPKIFTQIRGYTSKHNKKTKTQKRTNTYPSHPSSVPQRGGNRQSLQRLRAGRWPRSSPGYVPGALAQFERKKFSSPVGWGGLCFRFLFLVFWRIFLKLFFVLGEKEDFLKDIVWQLFVNLKKIKGFKV